MTQTTTSRKSWGRHDAGPGLLIKLVEVLVRSFWRHQEDVRFLKSLKSWPKPLPKQTLKLAGSDRSAGAIGVRHGKLFVGYRLGTLTKERDELLLVEMTSEGESAVNTIRSIPSRDVFDVDAWDLSEYKPAKGLDQLVSIP